MPIVLTVKGDLVEMFTDNVFDTIVHGCNCCNIMGAGIAKQIANSYPEVLDRDREYHDLVLEFFNDRIKMMGSIKIVQVWRGEEAKEGLIVNAYTQLYPGPAVASGEDRLAAIRSAFISLDSKMRGASHRIGIPKIGSGLAGGNWGEIEEVINSVTPNLELTLVEYNK